MSFTKRIAATLAFMACATAATAVHAEMSAVELEHLGKDLTPSGAEMGANTEGSIPAWTGGMSKPPAGWKPEMGYVDPFKGEKPLYVITARTADQYKERLSPGLMAMLKKYPTFTVPVYPTHRTFSLPQPIYDATKAQAGKARITGLSISGYDVPGIPFPVPKTGVEAIYDHTTKYFGGYSVCRDWLPVRFNGEYTRAGFCEDMIQGQNMAPREENNVFTFYGLYDAPTTLVGTIYLVRDPVDYARPDAARKAWIYNAGQRRVRRAPDVAYDNIDDGTEGMRTTDDYWCFHGALDRYDWKLFGKKEMYIPYNAYKLQDATLKYADMVDKGALKSDLMRYELHRVWVVEATLKPGMSHVIQKRVLYMDEDSHIIALGDGYDGRGGLWRVYQCPLVQAYDANVMFQAPYIVHDLSTGGYFVSALTNERKQPAYKWNVQGRASDYDVDAIRRRGTR